MTIANFFFLTVTGVALCTVGTSFACPCQAQPQDAVEVITPPAITLPDETASRKVTKFSFLAYGDTRGRRDGVERQYEHSLVIDSMLAKITELKNSDFPIKFVLQTGDLVFDGSDAKQWNISLVPLVDRLTLEGGVSYFPVPGNHDVSEATSAADAKRQLGLKNFLEVVSALIPPDGSQRRLAGYATYAFGYGNTFFLGFDANIIDDKQYNWVKDQLDGLDRKRYVNIVVFCHEAPFSSGPHGGRPYQVAEEQTIELQKRYMPLFNRYHVRLVISGHEHLFEHWVEHYSDPSGTHRMDLVVSGGGGAPIYGFRAEPNLGEFASENKQAEIKLEHLVKPAVDRGLNPYHFLLLKVDGNKIDLQVISVDWGSGFAPYKSNQMELQDP